MKFKSEGIKFLVAVIIVVLLEVFLSNHTFLYMKLGGYEPVELNIESAVLSENSDICKIENNQIILDKSKIRFQDVNAEMKNLCIETNAEFSCYINVEVAFSDDNFAHEGAFGYNRNTYQMYVADNYKNYISLSSFGKIKTLELNFPDEIDATFNISSVKINAVPEFHFSVFRFGILLILALLIYRKAWKWKFTDRDYSVIYIVTALICFIIILTMLFVSNVSGEQLLDTYPLDNTYTDDQYQQLFCSFKEGRLDINVDCDIEEFEKMSNPYDISERDESNLSGDFWDRAYYNGKFYSYFGVSPVFTVYYPVYLLTGQLPSMLCASAIISIYAVIFLSLLYMKVLKCFCKDVPYLVAVLGYLALIFGSSVLALGADKYFYYTAVISGIAWTSAFLYLILKAYFEKSFVKRTVLIVLSGISAVMIVASRPTMSIYCAIALIPAIYILKSKEETVKHKIIYACSMGVPLLLGAIGVMLYNYFRFDNVFEFGFNYQLTVSIAQANNLTLAYLPAALYHYFFQTPNINSQFPYINISYKTFSSYPRYTYLCDNIGAFSYPIAWGIFLHPFNDRKKDRFKTLFVSSLFSLAVLLAFIDMCKAGSHYRYTADILFPVILAAIVTVFDVLNMLRNSPRRVYKFAYLSAVFLLSATVVIGYLMIFANENKYFIYNYAPITQMLRTL